MSPQTKRLIVFLQRLSKLPGKLPGSLYVDVAQTGWIVGEALAKHQLETGFLGQKGGFGGAPFVPESVDLEFEFIRSSRVF